MRYIFLPGAGGSEPGHWQSIWERELGDLAVRIQPRSWTRPDPADWVRSLADVATTDCVLVAHSLGCLASAAWLTQAPRWMVRGAFLVAAPDPASPSFPPECAGFDPPRSSLGVPAVIIASGDDPYSSIRWSRAIAKTWAASLIELAGAGHINTEAGVGRWDEGRRLLAAFVAGCGENLMTPEERPQPDLGR